MILIKEMSEKDFEFAAWDVINDIVSSVRKELSSLYNIEKGGDFERFNGLCDEACSMVKEKLDIYAKVHRMIITSTIRHGEQAHHPRILSKYWPLQHTWLLVTWNQKYFFVDPTSSQFMDIYTDIPYSYISTNYPKWFYWDGLNPIYGPIGSKINKYIKLPWCDVDEGKWTSIGIIEFFQYKVWGSISDIIHYLPILW